MRQRTQNIRQRTQPCAGAADLALAQQPVRQRSGQCATESVRVGAQRSMRWRNKQRASATFNALAHCSMRQLIIQRASAIRAAPAQSGRPLGAPAHRQGAPAHRGRRSSGFLARAFGGAPAHLHVALAPRPRRAPAHSRMRWRTTPRQIKSLTCRGPLRRAGCCCPPPRARRPARASWAPHAAASAPGRALP